jgi:hypothetical protein
LVAQRDAIDAWRVGKKALDDGDPAGALKHFETASAARPKDALLVAWQGNALEAAQDLEGALKKLDRALLLSPKLGLAQYNRAAILARLGRTEDAAAQLMSALSTGVATAGEAAADPDFAAVLSDPAFSFLPTRAPTLTIDAPEGPVFWGSQVQVVLTAADAVSSALEAHVVGPAQQVASVLETLADGRVRWTFMLQVKGRGTIELGPFSVEGGTVVEAVVLEADAPEGKPEFQQPDQRRSLRHAGSWAEWLPETGALATRDEILVRAGPTDRLQGPVGASRKERHELRADGQSQWVFHRFVGLPAGPQTVEITHGGTVLWQGELTLPAPERDAALDPG